MSLRARPRSHRTSRPPAAGLTAGHRQRPARRRSGLCAKDSATVVRLAASLLPRREPACRFPAKGPLLRPVTHAPQWCSALGTRCRVAVHTSPAPHRSFAARAQPAPATATDGAAEPPVLSFAPDEAGAQGPAPERAGSSPLATRTSARRPPGADGPASTSPRLPTSCPPNGAPRHAQQRARRLHGSLMLAQVRAHPAQLNEGAASGSRHPQAACLTPHPRSLPAQADQQQDGWPKQPELRELFRPPTRHEWRLLRPAGARRP